MEESGKDDIYNSFENYIFNNSIFKRIRGEIGEYISSFPSSILAKQTEHAFEITKDCLRLKKYLLEFDSKGDCEKKNCCQYINYFLNERIRDGYSSNSSIFGIYNSYMNLGSNNNIKNICEYEINDIGSDKYEKSKSLYNMYELCDIFISKKYRTTSCSHAISCATAYNKIISDYPNIGDIKFCKALKDFKLVLERNDLISTSNCDFKFSNILSYSDECNKLLQKLEQGTSSMGHQTSRLQEQIESGGQSDLHKGDHAIEMLQENTISTGSFDATLPITLFSSGTGALLILLSFHKFTPLGQWLKHQTQRFGAITKNSDEELYEMQQPNSEYDERNTEYNVYNIAYNSL
ncbi:PIR protein [Plasmodium ovale]|uniref:PIR protein n=1 Tax=Plasmodium ovale TaxID=36330 RepID=A0A1D3JFF2_PLAOA|nr:PIR protein [Plasmodium ovale]